MKYSSYINSNLNICSKKAVAENSIPNIPIIYCIDNYLINADKDTQSYIYYIISYIYIYIGTSI